MTEENKQENIKDELLRASQALTAADLLSDKDLLNDAVSRLYYSMLHVVRALLLTKGLEPKSHEGVLRVFSLYFVKEGTFTAKDSHLFSRLMKYREEADYNPAYVFTREDYAEFKDESLALSDKITAYLKKEGYIG